MIARPRNDTLRLIGAGMLVLVLLAGVMLAAAAPQITVAASDLAGAAVLALLICGLVIAVVTIARGPLPWRSPYFWLAVFAGIVVAAGLVRGGDVAAPLPPVRSASPTPPRPPLNNAESASASGAFSMVIVLITVLLLVIAAVRAYAWWADSHEPTAGDAPATSESALNDAIDAALVDLRGDLDHRRAVIAAYAAAEASLATRGMKRLRAESPLEYLDRVVRQLGAKSAAVDRLTALYEQARFSEHTIDAAMRDEAIAAFEGLRVELEDAQ